MLATDEDVIRYTPKRQIGNLRTMLADVERLETAMQIGNVIGRKKDIVQCEPGRPEMPR